MSKWIGQTDYNPYPKFESRSFSSCMLSKTVIRHVNVKILKKCDFFVFFASRSLTHSEPRSAPLAEMPILFSWRLWESLSSRRCYIYTRWDNDQERILKTIFFTVKSILEWGSWWTQLPLGWVQTGIFNFFSSSSGTSRRGESPQYCSTTFPYYSLLLSADTPCPSDYHFISCVPAEPRLVQGRGRRELS